MRVHIDTIIWLLATVLCLASVHFYSLLYTPASWDHGELGYLGNLDDSGLSKAGVVKGSGGFVFAAALKGAHKKIKAGEYELSSSMTPMEILTHLVEGRTKKYSVTFPEGYSIKEIATALSGSDLAESRKFIERVRDRALVVSLGIDGPGLEGYLFPDTYRFTKGMGIDEIILKMVTRFKEVYNKEFREEARQKGFTMKEVVTIASIVEKEAGSVEEMPTISSVIQNRLKRGYRLRNDPTVIYGIKDFDGNLTKKHLLTHTPYNTYINYGLPPGPVSNPGRAALRATLNPSNEGYLYFVSRNDGTHHFSKTLEEHNRAVNLYQKGLVGKGRPNG
jgi:UPF0755 protein